MLAIAQVAGMGVLDDQLDQLIATCKDFRVLSRQSG
jgi:hypothetical protein